MRYVHNPRKYAGRLRNVEITRHVKKNSRLEISVRGSSPRGWWLEGPPLRSVSLRAPACTDDPSCIVCINSSSILNSQRSHTLPNSPYCCPSYHETHLAIYDGVPTYQARVILSKRAAMADKWQTPTRRPTCTSAPCLSWFVLTMLFACKLH